jgi:hypothetical protein
VRWHLSVVLLEATGFPSYADEGSAWCLPVVHDAKEKCFLKEIDQYVIVAKIAGLFT